MKHLANQGLLVLMVLLLAGCGGIPLLGIPHGSRTGSGRTPINSAFASTLSSDAATGTYTTAEGGIVTMTLGPSYVAASGQTCRIGRRDGDRYAYGFCRDGADWYAVPPALVSGN